MKSTIFQIYLLIIKIKIFKIQTQMSSILHVLQSTPQELSIQQILLGLCKPKTVPLQIDFLTLPQTLQQLHSFHQKTCQDIVQFVDAHCQQYLVINSKFQKLQNIVQKVQSIIEQLGLRLNEYAKLYYNNQDDIQQLITNYELKILEQILYKKSKQGTQFLLQFVGIFQTIALKPITSLTFNERHFLARFCHNFITFSNIFSHHIIEQALPQSGKIQQMMTNLVDEVEFYLSEQLQRVIEMQTKVAFSGNKTNPNGLQAKSTKQNTNKLSSIMNQIQLCYSSLNKLNQYYRLIEQHVVSLQVHSAEKNLINQKINLIGGKNIEVVQQYFKAIFNIFRHLPEGYPYQRILQLIFNLLKKNQIKFIYTYTLPIFPISYNAYIKNLNNLKFQQQVQIKQNQSQGKIQNIEKEINLQQKQIKQKFRKNHNWDLRRWVDVREKNILDRCSKDWEKTFFIKQNVQISSNAQLKNQPPSISSKQQINHTPPLAPDLMKWLEIIFKQNCKIEGVKNFIVELAIKVVNKYAIFVEKSSFAQNSFQIEFINMYVRTLQNIQKTLHQKITFFYEITQRKCQDMELQQTQNNQIQKSQQNSQQQLITIIHAISNSCQQTLQDSIQKLIFSNTKLIVKSCTGSLEPYKQFIMKIIKPSVKQKLSHQQQQNPTNLCVNCISTVFKPLEAYLQSCQGLSLEAKNLIRGVVTKQVMKYYDQSYVTEIYQYGRVNLGVEQLAEVMNVVGIERTGLFVVV